jgi:exopolysaccharide biosynthesis protein
LRQPGRQRARLIRALTCAVVAFALAGPTPALAALPSVYKVSHRDKIGHGVEHATFVRQVEHQVVNVARIKRGAPFDLRAVTSSNAIGNGLERTSSICRRVKCVLAVNGDFWKPGTDTPLGGVVSGGRLLRVASQEHAQVTVSADGALRTGPLKLRASLVPNDLRPLTIDAVNRQPKPNELIVFTPAYGRSTKTKKGTLELALRARPGEPISALAQTTVVKIAEHGSPFGNMPIPADGAVLAGRGRGAAELRGLLGRIRSREASRQALLRVESTPAAVESVGGAPILIRDGRLLPQDTKSAFAGRRHPRTLIGWTRSGDVLLVTVDGRQPGYADGMTLVEAARLMRNLGATDAVNLDGGGSTTFVSRGRVVNRPSDVAVPAARGARIVHSAAEGTRTIGHVERPVAIALAVVPRKGTRVTPTPKSLERLELPRIVDAIAPQGTDVASDPSGAFPAIVFSTARDDGPLRAGAVASLALAVALAAAWTAYCRALRRFERRVLVR